MTNKFDKSLADDFVHLFDEYEDARHCPFCNEPFTVDADNIMVLMVSRYQYVCVFCKSAFYINASKSPTIFTTNRSEAIRPNNV